MVILLEMNKYIIFDTVVIGIHDLMPILLNNLRMILLFNVSCNRPKGSAFKAHQPYGPVSTWGRFIGMEIPAILVFNLPIYSQ